MPIYKFDSKVMNIHKVIYIMLDKSGKYVLIL